MHSKMNLLTNCASTDISRNFAAMWMFISHILNVLCTGSSITITSRTCGEKYDMDFHKKIDVTHYGSNILHHNPCSVEFTKTSSKQYLCIYGDDIKLDCDTSLEYHEYFVKNFIPPEVKMSCDSISDGEWCTSQYQDNIFIVIRKSSDRKSDDIKLRVYLKDVPEDGYSESHLSTTIILIIVPIAVVILCIGVGVIIQQKCKKARTPRPQIAYQTTSGAVEVHAGQPQTGAYPGSAFNRNNPQAYFPVQQSGLQGNYNVYPMQTAYPMQQGAAPEYSQQGIPGQNYSNAPSKDISAPPPSYESLISEKH